MAPHSWNTSLARRTGRRTTLPLDLAQAVNNFRPGQRTPEEEIQRVLTELRFHPRVHTDGGLRIVDAKTGLAAVVYCRVTCCVRDGRPCSLEWHKRRKLELADVSRILGDELHGCNTEKTERLGAILCLSAAQVLHVLQSPRAWADPTNLCLVIPPAELPEAGTVSALVIVREAPRKKAAAT